MTTSKAIVFAGQTCYDVETRYPARSSYSAETLAATHNLEDGYPTIMTLRDSTRGRSRPLS
eukprot:204909-Pyramimonas_sp.AAC.2